MSAYRSNIPDLGIKYTYVAGRNGSGGVQKVWIEDDPKKTDISQALPDYIMQELDEEGAEKAAEDGLTCDDNGVQVPVEDAA